MLIKFKRGENYQKLYFHIFTVCKCIIRKPFYQGKKQFSVILITLIIKSLK